MPQGEGQEGREEGEADAHDNTHDTQILAATFIILDRLLDASRIQHIYIYIYIYV